MHHFAANTHTCVNSWAPSHQTNFSMRKCSLEQHTNTTFQTLLEIAGHCHMEHQGQGLPQCSQQRLAKRTCQRNPWGKLWNSNIFNHPYQTALGPRQHSGLDKINKLPNDHPQTSEGPDITSAQISTDQPHNVNIDEAPQNSSSQYLTRKVKGLAGLDLHWWQPPNEWSRARHRIRCIPPSVKRFPLCKPKRHGYNQHHLMCRASSYSSCSHTRLLTYSHRQPYITAPNKKAALTPKSPSPPHVRKCPSIHCWSNPPITIAHPLLQNIVPCRYYQ